MFYKKQAKIWKGQKKIYISFCATEVWSGPDHLVGNRWSKLHSFKRYNRNNLHSTLIPVRPDLSRAITETSVSI